MNACASCAFELPPSFAFCPRCGAKQPQACASCGFPLPADFAFCPKCGGGAGAAAASVAVPALAGAAPSPPSGEQRVKAMRGMLPGDLAARLREAAEKGSAEGERRPVTILFADISGFTALSETLDPEEVVALVDRCLRSMAQAIYTYEGTVDKYIGDCVMTLFGAPMAHEDDPERAIRAALDMREAVAAINSQLEAGGARGEDGKPVLSLHIGINTGVVVAGAVGADQRRDYTVLGDAVNVASRLESAAAGGEVVVGDPTYRLAKHAFTFEALEPLPLKGKAQPLLAHRVLSTRATPLSRRGLEGHGLTTPLVGREQELSQMVGAFERMLTARTQVVSLIGEAGVGKSRLQSEFLERLRSRGLLEGVAVRSAFCSPLGERTYGLMSSIYREGFAIAPSDPPAAAQAKVVATMRSLGAGELEIERVKPLLGHLLGIELDDSAIRHLEPEQVKRQLFRALLQLLELRLAPGPLMVLVDDLHWADAASVELLRFLVDRLPARRLLFLVAHRPSFDAGALMSGRADHTAIRLSPLTAGDSAALLTGFFGDSLSAIPLRLRQLVVERAGGNPFYLEEVLRDLIESGALRHEAKGWICAQDAGSLDVPATVQGVLLARLDRLPPDTRRFLQEVAVLGPIFGDALIPAVCSQPAEAAHHLDVLHDAELVEDLRNPAAASREAHGGDHRHRFTHALVQEVAYQSLLLRRRSELHGRAGEALVGLLGGQARRAGDLEALGRHFSLSADSLRGAGYYVAAGDWARAVYANEDAAADYARALEVMEGCDPADSSVLKLRAEESLGDALGAVGGREEALTHLQTVLEATIESGDRVGQARLHRKLGLLEWGGGGRERASAHFEQGLAALEGAGEEVERASLFQEMGRLHFRSGNNREAIAWARRALELTGRLATAARGEEERRQVAGVAADAHNTVGVALARTGKLEEAVAEVERSVAVATEGELLQVACRAYTNLGVLYSTLDPGQAIQISLQGLELAKKIGDLGSQSWLYANLAGAYCTFTGQCEEEGIEAATTAIELDRQLGQLDHLAVPLIVLGQIYQCHGNPDLALKCYEEAVDLAERIGEPQLLFPGYDGLATLHLEMGDEALAESYMLKGQQVCESAGVEPDSLVVLPFLC